MFILLSKRLAYLKIRVTRKEGETARMRSSVHWFTPLCGFKGHGPSQEPRAPSAPPCGWLEPQDLGHLCCFSQAVSRELAGKWSRWNTVGGLMHHHSARPTVYLLCHALVTIWSVLGMFDNEQCSSLSDCFCFRHTRIATFALSPFLTVQLLIITHKNRQS